MQALSIIVLALLAFVPALAQTSNFVADNPVVKTAVEKFLAEQTTRATTTSTKFGVRFATTSPLYGGGLMAPPVALRLNRIQFDEHDVLQATLVLLNKGPIPNNPMALSVLWIHLDSNQTRGTYAGRHVLLSGDNETIPLQTYIFDGSEPSGLYALVVMVIDTVTGQLVAMPGTHFVFRSFLGRYDLRGNLRVDSATEMVGPFSRRFITLRGNFLFGASAGQFVLIGNWQFPIVGSEGNTATVDMTGTSIPAGVYDVTLVVHLQGNTAYDSTTAPCALKIFLP